MRIQKLWQKIGLVVAGLATLEFAARISLPGLNTQVFRDYILNNGTSGLIALYNRIGGGALSKGGLVALGFLPYISARIWVRLARLASPALNELAGSTEGRGRLTRLTRVITVGASLVQSYGFARFLQTIPDAVANPGMGFTVQTVLLLTSGSIIAMLLSEQITNIATQQADGDALEPAKSDPLLASPVSSLGAPQVPVGETVKVK